MIITDLITQVVPMDAYNPFKGLSPNFGPFAPLLESRTQKLLAAGWAIAFVYLAARLIMNVSAFAKAKRGKYGHDLDEARTEAAWTGGALVAVAAIGAIYGVLVAF